jgi:hypothetical protein
LYFPDHPIETRESNWILNCVFSGQVICEKTCSDTGQEGVPFDQVVVVGDGSYTFDCDTTCFLFMNKIGEGTPYYIPGYRYGDATNKEFISRYVNKYLTKETNTILDLKFPETGTSSLGFTSEIAFAGVVNKDAPEFSIEENGYNPDIGILYATITNTGGIGAAIDTITLENNPNANIIYSPTKLEAGKSDDIIISIMSDTAHLDIAYRAEKLGCQKQKEYANSYAFNLQNTINPYEQKIQHTQYDIILKKGIEPENNLLDLRLILGTQ